MNVSFILMMYQHILCLSCLLLATVTLTTAFVLLLQQDVPIYKLEDLQEPLINAFHFAVEFIDTEAEQGVSLSYL